MTTPTVLASGYGLLEPLEQAGHRVVRRDRPGAPEVRLTLAEDARAAAAVEREHLVLRRRRQHRPEVVDVRRELGLDLLAHELGHRLHAGRGVARLVVEVGVLERRSAQLLDVLGRQVEAAAHRLAVERAGAGQRQHRAELDRLALAGAGLLDAEQLGEVGLAAAAATAGGRRAAAGRGRRGSAAGRRGRAAAARRRSPAPPLSSSSPQAASNAAAPIAPAVPSSIRRRVTRPSWTISVRSWSSIG